MNLYRLTKFQEEKRMLQYQLSMVYKLQLSIYDSYIFKKENKKAVNVSGKYFTMSSFGYWIDFHIFMIKFCWFESNSDYRAKINWYGAVFIFNSINSPFFSQLFFSFCQAFFWFETLQNIAKYLLAPPSFHTV